MKRVHRPRKHKSAANKGADGSYAVGYGRPPVTSRFRPGASGNAAGRPKGSKNLKTLIKEEMTAPIAIQEGNNSRRVSKIVGVVLRQIQSALKGNDRSAMAVIKMATLFGFLEDPEGNNHQAAALSAVDEQILAALGTRSGKRRRRRRTANRQTRPLRRPIRFQSRIFSPNSALRLVADISTPYLRRIFRPLS